MIATVSGRLDAKHPERVVVHTAGGVGYEVVVPLGVMERLPAIGEPVTLETELVVREDGWSLYGFLEPVERQFFRRLTSVAGVGPKLAVALMSTLGVARGARALAERNIGLLSSVNGIGKKTAERLVLELADKLDEFVGVDRGLPAGAAETARQALEALGFPPPEAERALRQALAADGAAPAETLVRHALRLLTARGS